MEQKKDGFISVGYSLDKTVIYDKKYDNACLLYTSRELSHAFADSIYYCSNYTGRIGTQEMNEDIYDTVSYTHLDVYKRQVLCCAFGSVPPCRLLSVSLTRLLMSDALRCV